VRGNSFGVCPLTRLVARDCSQLATLSHKGRGEDFSHPAALVLAMRFFAHPRHGASEEKNSPPKPKKRKPDLRQMPSGSGGSDASRSGAAHKNANSEWRIANGRPIKPYSPFAIPHSPIKKEAERRQTLFLNRCAFRQSAHPAGRARLSAFHGGSRQRDAGPQGSAPGHAFRDPPERTILWTANRGEDRAPLHGRYPRRNNPGAASTSRAGRYAGRMMPEAARVQR
jgi:hypothetical protein